jgi:DNA-binding winged helix-turn-helix (wHTH) protein
LNPTKTEGEFHLGRWRVQPDLNRLSTADTAVRIEPRVMEVLLFLARHQGEVLSKERILGSVWAGTHVTPKVLTYSISELRRALEDDSKNPAFIQTIPRRGYRLMVPVRGGDFERVTAAAIRFWPRARFRHLFYACICLLVSITDRMPLRSWRT